MSQPVYSFSAKTEDDKQLVKKLKTEASKTGRSFSWLVLQALKQYDSNKEFRKGN